MLSSLLAVVCFVHFTSPHVIFLEPPSRASIGIIKQSCRLPKNVDHMSLYCGGYTVQHNSINKGRCGICGDPFSSAVKPHQAGGRFATGTIGRSYMPGELINIEADLVANHKGFFTFAICPHNNVNTSPDRSCFINNPLTVNSGERYYATQGTGIKRMRVKLPNITCKQCILQLTYTAGNNWGIGPQSAEAQSSDCVNSAEGKLGCGQQETFRGCADICIGSFCPKETCAKVSDIDGGTITPTTVAPWTPPPNQFNICKHAGINYQYYSPAGDQYCKLLCLNKTPTQCYRGANTKLLCFCSQDRALYEPVTVDIPDRV